MVVVLSANSLVGAPCTDKPRYKVSNFPSQRTIVLAFQCHRHLKNFKVKGFETNFIMENKELEFKPSFDEYLEVMESLKTNEREKMGRQSSIGKSDNGKNLVGSRGKERIDNMRNKEEKIVDMKKDALQKKLKKPSGGNKSFVSKGIVERESSGVERAAFQHLEEYKGVYDKPRVTRMDMEERLQKLAKSLNGADIDMPEWMFSNMMRSANIRFSDHSILRIIQLLEKLGNWRRVLQIIEWLQSRERFKSHKMRYIYTTALNVLRKSKRPVEALNLFHAMQKQMCIYPDLVAYRSIAVTLGQAGYLKELFDVIDSMRSLPKKNFKTGVLEKWDPCLEPDIVVYNAVLNACVKREKWEGAFWVLQQLKEQGHELSSTTYGLVMEVMLVCGKYNLVHDFFRKMQKSCIPNALTYKVLLNAFWKEGEIDNAIKTVEDMERRGVVGTAGLYYDLARCLCSAGRCREALMQISKICKVADKPIVVTYTGLIQVCLDSGYMEDAAIIFEEMRRFCSPNLVTCNIMMKGYLQHGLFEEAKQLFMRLLENSRHIGSKEECMDKIIPDIYTFNLLLDASFADKRWDDLEFVYSCMLKYGYRFNSKRHLRMVLHSCAVGKVELLHMTWVHLIRNNQILPAPLIKEMFRLKLEEGDCDAALSCLACHPHIDLQAFSIKCWSKFFVENFHRFKKDDLVKLLDAVKLLDERTLKQNQMYHNLVASVEEFLDKHMAYARFQLSDDSCRDDHAALLLQR